MEELNKSGVSGVPTLLGTSNFDDWRYKMKAYLVFKDLWSVTGATGPLYDTEPILPPGNEDQKLLDRYKAWHAKNLKASAAIDMSMGPETRALISGVDNAKEKWDLLHSTFQLMGLGNVINLEMELIYTKQEPDESIEKFYTTLRKKWDAAVRAGSQLSEAHVCHVLLRSVSAEWQPLASQLIHSLSLNSMLMSLNWVYQQLRAEELRKESISVEMTNAQALVARHGH